MHRHISDKQQKYKPEQGSRIGKVKKSSFFQRYQITQPDPWKLDKDQRQECKASRGEYFDKFPFSIHQSRQ